MIVKGITDNSRSWIIYHSALGATKYFQFDNTSAGTNAGPWNNTEPTSKFFTLGTSYNNVNVSGGKKVTSHISGTMFPVYRNLDHTNVMVMDLVAVMRTVLL